MEEHIDKIIYIILLIAISLIPALKKKNKARQVSPTRQDASSEDSEQDQAHNNPSSLDRIPPKYRSILEQITGIEIDKKSDAQQDTVRLSLYEEMYGIQKQKPKKIFIESSVNSDSANENIRNTEESQSESGFHFDSESIRSAVIYSEIINRKY